MNSPAVAALRKDLRITRVLWAPMAFSFAVFLMVFMESRWVFLATGACLTFVAAATAAGIEDRYQAEPFLAALPGTRRSLVTGRYLSWAVFTAAGLALFMASTALLHAGLGWRSPRLLSLLSVKGGAAFLAGSALAGLVYLPLYFRFGFWPGMGGFTAAGFVASVLGLSALPRLVPAEACGAAQAGQLPGLLGALGRGLRALAWVIDNRFDDPPVIAAGVALLIALGYLSYRLSVRAYSRRNL
jgi:hypothetical protein